MKVRTRATTGFQSLESPGRAPSARGWDFSERSAALRAMLEERAQQVRAELETLSRRLREEDRPEAWDEGDRATYGLGREMGTARMNQLTRMLRQIEDAIARHAEGHYGYCARCDGEIPVARLRSLPFTVYCRDCQEIQENEERRAEREEIRLAA